MTQANVDWQNPFSTELSFLEDVSRLSPEDLASSITSFDIENFLHISIADFLNHDSALLKDIAVQMLTLSDNITECLIADHNLTNYMLNFGDVCTSPS